MQISFSQDHRERSARGRSSVTVLETMNTGNRYACLSLGTDRIQGLLGGGESDSTSPPKKKRRRSKNSDLGRRRKTSHKPTTTSSSAEERQDEQGNSPDPEATNSSKSAEQSGKKSAWRNSPRGKESIAKSREKYESSEKAHLTRQRYESNEGLITRRRYESNEGLETRRRYESNEGLETRRRYESNEGLETRRRYESNEGLETRRRYESNEGLETRRRYESNEGLETRNASQQGSDRKIRYELSPGGEATRRRYKSEEGASVRAAYSRSDDGVFARRRTVTKYKNTEAGRKAQDESRRRYELRESAKQRKLLYYKRQAYTKRVKKAVSHLVQRDAAKAHIVSTEEEQQFPDEEHGRPDTERTEEREPGVEESTSNKEAMATIRSHKVS